MKKFIELYLSFLKIGAFTIGGGYVMVPLMQELAVNQKDWCTDDEIMEYITIAQSLPGMFGANVATNVGYKVKGTLGAISALLGMITPSLVIITLFASVYDNLMEYEMMQNAFKGMQSAVVALIFLTVIKLYKKAIKKFFQNFIILMAIILTFIFNISPFYLILSGIIIGIVYSVIVVNKNKKVDE